MRVLFDQGTPSPLRPALTGHAIRTAYEMGWSELVNGDLLRAAESAGFEALVTTDQNIRHQQNLAARRLAFVVPPTTSWPEIRAHVADVAKALDGIQPGEVREIKFTGPHGP